MCTRIGLPVHKHIRRHVYSKFKQLYKQINNYTYTYICVYTYIYIHIHMYVCMYIERGNRGDIKPQAASAAAAHAAAKAAAAREGEVLSPGLQLFGLQREVSMNSGTLSWWPYQNPASWGPFSVTFLLFERSGDARFWSKESSCSTIERPFEHLILRMLMCSKSLSCATTAWWGR